MGDERACNSGRRPSATRSGLSYCGGTGRELVDGYIGELIAAPGSNPHLFDRYLTTKWGL